MLLVSVMSLRNAVMAGKTKVSLFLEPSLAKALKIQAARHGHEGVSSLVSSTFLCAHCQEPITEDFVVGIKNISPNRFGVLFHANKKDCVSASGTKAISRK